MPSPESLELAQRFFRKAREDRGALEILIASERAADAVIGFHAQQAVEKFAKAALLASDIDVPRTHDLRFLLDLATSGGLVMADEVRAARWLTPWSVEFRYGDELSDPSTETRLPKRYARLSSGPPRSSATAETGCPHELAATKALSPDAGATAMGD